MAGTNSLEIEIHNLFQDGASIEVVSRELVAKYEKNEVLSSSEIEGLSHFLITCGQFELLKKLYIKCIKYNKISSFPTGFFVEALLKQKKSISNAVIDLCDAIILAQPREATALNHKDVKKFSMQVAKEARLLQQNYSTDRLRKKTELIEQLNHYRSANLPEQEELILQQLTKLYPNDLEVGLIKQAHLEKKADEILAKIISQKQLTKPRHNHDKDSHTLDFLSAMKENILKISEQVKVTQPDQLYNLAILAYQFELYNTSITILEMAPETNARNWLMAEALIEAGRYLDALSILHFLENQIDQNTDAAFGATYLKAIAYHGLGQVELAIRLMESILQVVPFYRSAEALVVDWRTSL
ncbi:MAG: hypothetical protein ACK41T_01870 [Pseudobdellovibrio sp.]